MKLITVYTSSHERLKDEWFLPTLPDEFELTVHKYEVVGSGAYLDKDWTEAVLFKSEKIIETIQENLGEILVYSDIDIQFFAPMKDTLLNAMTDKDILCQLDDPSGNLCSGFIIIRASERTLTLWQEVYDGIKIEHRDQIIFNRLIRNRGDIRFGYLPDSFFGAGTFCARIWEPGMHCYIPSNPIMHHANWTIGIDHKIALLDMIRNKVNRGKISIVANNFNFFREAGANSTQKARSILQNGRESMLDKPDSVYRPDSVTLDASTACQLKCPSCPTANGVIARQIGSGILHFEDFKRFVDKHPYVSQIELSNWGEIFLNPDLEKIVAYAYRRNIMVKADNGVNLNRASEKVLEALVKYKFRSMTCSIDGASQETYAQYRVNGDFNQVISYIRTINDYKKKYRSPYPKLKWQYIAFGHNEHEIAKARSLAEDLNMSFYLKISWNDLYGSEFSPVKNRKLIRYENKLGIADRREYEEKFGQDYAWATCLQMWLDPRINFDGKVLGCSINHWGDYGNAFDQGLESCLSGEKMRKARKMLMGELKADAEIPCTNCQVYDSMKKHDSWIRPEHLQSRNIESRRVIMLHNRAPRLLSISRKIMTAISMLVFALQVLKPGNQ